MKEATSAMGSVCDVLVLCCQRFEIEARGL